jgi:hypothetical protein
MTGIDQPPPLPAPRPLSISGAISTGWQSLKIGYGPLLLASTIYVGSSVVFSVLEYTAVELLAVILSWAKMIFFDPPFTAGVIYTGVRLARGHDVDVGSIFAGFERYWQCVGIGALILLATWGVMLPGGVIIVASMFASVYEGALGFVGIIVGLGVMLATFLVVIPRLWFASTVCLDEWTGRPGVLLSIKSSWAMTSGRWVQVAGLLILLGLIGIASTIALVLPLIFFAIPFGSATWGAAYAQLAQDTIADPDTGACWNCGYDVSTIPGRQCPECGTQLTCDGCGASLRGCIGACLQCGARITQASPTRAG